MNPLLLDVPDRIETERLVLRAFKPGDGAMVAVSVRESLPELKQWMPWANDDYNAQSGEEWCRKAAADFIVRSQLQYVILLRGGTHVGNVGAFAFGWDVPMGEIGYWLRTSHCGHGYMSEAVNGLTQMLFDSLKFLRVEIRMNNTNERSWRVAERCGFMLEGILRHHGRDTDGSLRDLRIYSKIQDP